MFNSANLGGMTSPSMISSVNAATPDVSVGTGVDISGSTLGNFLSDNMSAIGTLASVIGGIMANKEKNKFSKKVYADEKARADREEQRATKFRADFASGW